LVDAARALEDHANEIYTSSLATALERQHDGRARWVALTISNRLRMLFGTAMYGQTATIASVILDHDIHAERAACVGFCTKPAWLMA
jgi:hypothetical protein